MERNCLPTIIFPRGSTLNEMPSESSNRGHTASSLSRTPTKKSSTAQSNDENTPTPKRKRLRSARDFRTKRVLPKTLGFPNSFNEAINAAFAEEHYDAGLEMMEQSLANGIVPADHHLRILYAFALRPTPDPVTYRQTSSVFMGAVSAPPSLPLIIRARTLLSDLARIHGSERILRPLCPGRIVHTSGIDAPSKTSLRSVAVNRDHFGPSSRSRIDSSPPGSADNDDDHDGFDNESSVAQLQKNAFLVPFPLYEKRMGGSRSSLVPAVKDTWEALRVPPPGSLAEADNLRKAKAIAEADQKGSATLTLAAAQIRSIVMRYPGRRRGRGKAGGGMAADLGGVPTRSIPESDFTQEELLRYAPAAMERYNEVVYGKNFARDQLRTRAVNGEAFELLATLWQEERRDLLYRTQGAGGSDAADKEQDKVNAIKSFYGLTLAWDFPLDKEKAHKISTEARKARSDSAKGTKAAATATPAKSAKSHPWFSQRFATSAPSQGFHRSSSTRGSSPPSSQASAGGPPSSPAGPSHFGQVPPSPSQPAARIVRQGPTGCVEVGQALDAIFEVVAGNVLLYDRDGMFRSALAHTSGKMDQDGAVQMSALAALGSGGAALLNKWHQMIRAAAVVMFELLQLSRQADTRTAPVLDPDALERGIAQRLAWADVGSDAIAGIDQTFSSKLDEEMFLALKMRQSGSSFVPSFEWETEPSLCWTRAMVEHLKKVGSVLRQGTSRTANRSAGGHSAGPSSQRSDRSSSLPPATSPWEETLSKFLQNLPKSFAWMEINRKRWMDHQEELKDDGLARFADIDAQRERRLWANLEDVETGDDIASERVVDIEFEISEILVVRGRQPVTTVPAPSQGRRRDRSPSILFVFEEGPAFRTRARSASIVREDSPDFEIVQVTPSKKMKETSSSSAAATSLPVGDPSALPAVKVPKERSRSEAVRWQTREWVLDWGLDALHTLKSSRRPAEAIDAKAPPTATLDDHTTRLNALLRVSEVVLGEVRRRRKAALIKSAVLAWGRRCVPVPGSSSAVLDGPASQRSAATDEMDWEPVPTSSAAVSAVVGTLQRPSQSSSTSLSSSRQAASASFTPAARALLDKLEDFCADAATSATGALDQAHLWLNAVRSVWEEAIAMGLVSTSRTGGATPAPVADDNAPAVGNKGKAKAEVKKELGEAVNWAFALEMERLLKAIEIEVQGLSGTVLGWQLQALSTVAH